MSENIDPTDSNQDSNDIKDDLLPNDLNSNKSFWKPNFNFVFYYLLPIVSFVILLFQFVLDSPTISSFFKSPEIEVEIHLDTLEWRTGNRQYLFKNVGNKTAENISIKLNENMLCPISKIDSIFFNGLFYKPADFRNFNLDYLHPGEEYQIMFYCNPSYLKDHSYVNHENKLVFSDCPSIYFRYKENNIKIYEVYTIKETQIITDSLGNYINTVPGKVKRIELTEDEDSDE
jgi:hypothetical protein